MKKWMILLCMTALAACNRYDAGIPAEERQQLATTLESSSRPDALRELLRQTPRDERAATAWLLNRMTPGDRDTMRLDLLRENVAYACRARREFPWAKALPEEIFRNEVLPYASVDEVRDAWRRDFYERLAPRVAGCSDMRAAIDTVNRILPEVVGVEYNTLREKTNQSPAESMRQGMASCTGLSILLVDALRAVGIPARFAGTAAWHDERGNHSWTEVWIDGEWYFTEYYPTPALNHSWFLERAGKADKSDPIYWMYATSWKPTGLHFPMVWDMENKNVPGIDVTDFYIDLYNAQMAEAKNGAPVVIRVFKTKDGGRSSADRVAQDVKVVDADGNMVAAGKTAGPTADMNDYLTLYLPFDRELKAQFTDASGAVQSADIKTPKAAKEGEELTPIEIELYAE